MNKINDLIIKLCPNGVDYKHFFEVAKYLRGITYNKNDETDSDDSYKVLRANNITLCSNKLNFDDVKKVLSKVKVKEEQWLKKGDILICAGSGSKEHIGKVAYINSDIKYTFGGFMGVIRCSEIIDSEFMFHILTSNIFREHIGIAINSTTINNINNQTFENLKIPVPPLEVQKEIINILNKFDGLISNLEEEQELRKKQYNFWSNLLLNDSNSNIKKLEDIAIFSQGIQVEPSEQFDYCSDDMVPFLRIVDFVKNNEPPRYIKKPDDKYLKKENEEIVMIRYGAAAAGKVFINKSGAIANNMFKINITDKEVNVRYLWYYLSQDKIYNLLNNKSSGSTMPAINFKLASSLDVVLPPLECQEKIVKILDKFMNLIDNYKDGIPAEIEQRKKQYNYYKNEILSFKGIIYDD